LLVYRELNVLGSSMTQTKAKALVDFLWWAIHDGQDYSAALVYVPLPAGVVDLNEQTIGLVTFNGQALHT
jgi:phosphate transport system substrate-binding protein